jgi:hypothetical protein
MTGSSGPSASGASAGLVVMGCASEDAESLQEAMDALRRDGLEVELCEGLDDDPRRLSDVIDHHEGRGLYVLCRSPRLGRERVEELREILLARHVPFARTLTVAVGGRGALADRIRAGLRRASARASGPNRTVDAAARGASTTTEDDEPTVVGKPEGVSEELELVPSQPIPLPPRLPRASAPIEVSVVEAIEEVVDDRASSWSVPTIATDLDLSDLDKTGPTRLPPPGDATAPVHQTALITGNTVVGPAPAMITGDTLTGEKLPRALREAAGRWPLPTDGAASPDGDPATTPFPRMTPAMLAPLPTPGASAPPLSAPSSLPPLPTAPAAPPLRAAPASLPPPGAAAPSPSIPAPPSSPAPGAAASSPSVPAPPSSPASEAAGSSTPLAAPPSRPPAPRPSLPPAPPPGPAPGAWASGSSLSHDDEPTSGRGKLLPWALGAVALSLLVLVIALAISSGGGTAEVASGDEPAADDAPASTPSPSEPTSDEREGARADEASEPPAVYPVVAALETRKVRALDVLLVATTWGKPSDWSTAAAYCEGLDVEGVRGWRLPHIGELHSLAQASMISRGMFWSSTAADTFGDEHMAWNARRDHAQPYAADAVPVCVRGGEASGS